MTRRLLGVLGAAAAALAITAVADGTASAAPAAPHDIPGNCDIYQTDHHVWASVRCYTTGVFRLRVTYCRATCSYEYGNWASSGNWSDIEGNSQGGSISDPQVEFELP